MSLESIRTLAQAGQIREAFDRCVALSVAPSGDPYRDVAPLPLAEIHHELGTLAWANARFDVAERSLARAYELRCAAVGANHPLALETLERQAALAGYRSQDEVARSLFRQVIDGYVGSLGGTAKETAIARRNFAAFLRDAGDLAAAREQLDMAMSVIAIRCGRAHASYAAALKVDAMLSYCENQMWKALQQAERAIDTCERCHGFSHPHTAAARLIAARAELALDRGMQARAHVQRALADLEAGYGEHPLLGLALDCAAAIDLELKNDLAEAERHARRSVAIYERTYPDAADIGLPTLHSVLEHRSKWAEAGAVCELIAKRVATSTKDEPDAAEEWQARARLDYSYARRQPQLHH